MRAILPAVLVATAGIFSAALPASADEPVIDLLLHCDHNTGKIASLEEPYYVNQGCWQHHGAHHFFVGRDVVYRLHGGTGFIGGKEQELSVRTEWYPGQIPDPLGPPIWFLETSLDGLAWTKHLDVDFSYHANGRDADVTFNVPSPGEAFRFFRVRTPLSATGGLAGYEDGSFWTLQVSVDSSVQLPLLQPMTVAKGCEQDILEDIVAEHPCWYGGLHYYDAPSFFHTYFLKDARLDRVSGTATALYWRAADIGGVQRGIQAEGVTHTVYGTLFVQTSVDSVTWDTVGTHQLTYALEGTFDFPNLGGVEAKFVRLAIERHPYWAQTGCYQDCAPLHHNEGYLYESHLTLEGQLPKA